MTLGFSTKWPKHMGALANQPNYFIEKIWEGILRHECHEEETGTDYIEFKKSHSQTIGKEWNCQYYTEGELEGDLMPVNLKLHTIREGSRWRAGVKIHPVINNRTKNRFQFAPTLVCTGVQELEIKWQSKNIVTVYVDGKDIHTDTVQILAVNDGFDNAGDFFAYFNQDFKGQIIHWTDLRY